MSSFEPRVLGKTGHMVGALGVGSSYGVGEEGVAEAFDRGVRYFYWAWSRRSGMQKGLQKLNATNRNDIFLTITSLTPTRRFIRFSVERALRALKTDYIDALQFYMWSGNKGISSSQLETALKLKDEGKIKFISATGHQRPRFPKFLDSPFSDLYHIRYNAIHRGAETDVFPNLPEQGSPNRPGIVCFTATSWRQLLKASPTKLGGLKNPTAGDCYRFVLSNKAVDVCLCGAADDDQMRHALDAIDKGPMDEEELDWMRKVGEVLYK